MAVYVETSPGVMELADCGNDGFGGGFVEVSGPAKRATSSKGKGGLAARMSRGKAGKAEAPAQAAVNSQMASSAKAGGRQAGKAGGLLRSIMSKGR